MAKVRAFGGVAICYSSIQFFSRNKPQGARMHSLRYFCRFSLRPFSLLLCLLCLCLGQSLFAQDSEVYVSEAVVPVVLEVDLSQLNRAEPWQPGDPITEVPERSEFDFPTFADPDWVDPVAQSRAVAPTYSGSSGMAFDGIAFTGSRPPDTVGDVGPNHYIQMANASFFSIWDKLGNQLAGPTLLESIWVANGGSAAGDCDNGRGDPIVIYDDLADRWLISEFTFGNDFCMYVSRGPDPVTDGWFVYEFTAPNFPDYPQYGVWPDGYYVSTFESPRLGAYAFDRAAMLVGDPATFQRFQVSALNGSASRVTRLLPADLDGTDLPPDGTPNFFVRSVEATQDSSDPNDRLEVWAFHADFITPANSSFSLHTSIPVSFSFIPCAPGIRDCVTQPGTGNKIDALFNRMLRRMQFRQIDGISRMVGNQVVNAGAGVGGVRWYELRISPFGEGEWSVFQQGTYSPDTDSRFMGSAAMDARGNIGLAYSASSGTLLPSIRATGRKVGDPLGQMTFSEIHLKDGEGVQTSSQRWGDYSSLTVDPVDGSTFWYSQQYMLASGQWRLHVSTFNLEGLFSDSFESGDTSAWTFVVP
jgi:hypothetical protein